VGRELGMIGLKVNGGKTKCYARRSCPLDKKAF